MSPYETLLREANGRPFAAIVGWPVEHSRSPALHGFWLKQHAIDGHYGRLPVEPKRAALEELITFLKRTPNARGRHSPTGVARIQCGAVGVPIRHNETAHVQYRRTGWGTLYADRELLLRLR